MTLDTQRNPWYNGGVETYVERFFVGPAVPTIAYQHISANCAQSAPHQLGGPKRPIVRLDNRDNLTGVERFAFYGTGEADMAKETRQTPNTQQETRLTSLLLYCPVCKRETRHILSETFTAHGRAEYERYLCKRCLRHVAEYAVR